MVARIGLVVTPVLANSVNVKSGHKFFVPTFYFLLITHYLLLFLPKLIVAGFDLIKLTSRNEQGAFADIGHAVCDALEIMRYP